MTTYEQKCIELKKHIDKCLKINIKVFGEERGIVMCEKLQTMHRKYCLDIN
jgi:hypothetical protein